MKSKDEEKLQKALDILKSSSNMVGAISYIADEERDNAFEGLDDRDHYDHLEEAAGYLEDAWTDLLDAVSNLEELLG